MSLIDGNSRFSKSAVKDISRSMFDRSNTLLTSFSAGKLVPLYVDEVLPGDTVTMDMSLLCRMATPLYPVMDNAWIDIHWFFVPNRLVWEHWKNFMGESDDAWEDDVVYSVPKDTVILTKGTLYDYLGLPCDHLTEVTVSADVSALPRRAYQLIWNEWYRDENLQDPVLIDKGDTGLKETLSSRNSAFNLLSVNKYKDYFTSCLPQPQKGVSVTIPGFGVDQPVKTRQTNQSIDSLDPYGLRYHLRDDLGSAGFYNLYMRKPDASNPVGSLASAKVADSSVSASNIVEGFVPMNLYADLRDPSATINQLRQAFAIQRLLETDARGGTRYRELVKAHFGVDIGDARVQVPEYLGGAHIPINIMQVVQQSSTASEPSPLGETGAMSKTVHSGSMFTKSFVEHGFLFCLASVRTQHSYQQGINRMWSRSDRYDFYWPELANIGEQAVLNKEIFYDQVDRVEEVFGYQEAWADYRYKPNIITGNMRQVFGSPTANTSLALWHYGDFYIDPPSLSGEWVAETDENIARTLAVSDTAVFDQFLCDCYFKARWARPMPLYSIPGLSGHF